MTPTNTQTMGIFLRRGRFRRFLAPSAWLRAHAELQLLQCPFVANDEQRLAGSAQQIEELAVICSRVYVCTICQQGDRAATADRVEQPNAEFFSERLDEKAHFRDRQSIASQVGKHDKLEKIDR